PRPCRMTTRPRSWREMILETHRARQEILSHMDFPVDDLGRELGLTEPSFETVFDTRDQDPGELAGGTVLWIGVREQEGLVLRLRYRTERIDQECASRIAGYHLAALALIATDADAEHREQSLLSEEELRFQLHGLAGPRRKLPSRPVHELFEEQV